MRRAFRYLAVVGALLLAANHGSLRAQVPVRVPQNLPAAKHATLNVEKAGLDQWHEGLVAKAVAYNSKCATVPANTPLAKQCREELASLENEKAKYYAAVKKFNRDVAEAGKHSQPIPLASPLQSLQSIAQGGDGLKDAPNSGDSVGLKTLPDVNTEPNVVDARNVPSGLPKSVDDAIASGYSSAPPGVSDRVRKGFQAITTHDWKVARAWFEDALNHDPDNAGLKRLVDLADYTEKRIQPGNTGKSTNQSSPLRPMQLPKDSDIQYLFPGWKPAKANPSSTSAGSQMQMPKDSDIEFLFPGLPAIQAREMNDYIFDQALKDAENDPVLIKLSNRPGP